MQLYFYLHQLKKLFWDENTAQTSLFLSVTVNVRGKWLEWKLCVPSIDEDNFIKWGKE